MTWLYPGFGLPDRPARESSWAVAVAATAPSPAADGVRCSAFAAGIASPVHIGVARTAHPLATEIVPSDHCVHRFRQRMPVRDPGVEEVAAALIAALEGADVSGWPPGWAVSDRPAELWAVSGDVAFPLTRTTRPRRWLAVTCLRRASR